MASRFQQDFDFVASALEDGYIFLRDKEPRWGFRFDEVRRSCARRVLEVQSDFEFWLLLNEVTARVIQQAIPC